MIAQGVPITVHLPDVVYRQFRRTAQRTKQRVEDVVLQAITGNPPPALEEFPADLQPALQPLAWVDDHSLWEVARSQVSREQQARHEVLLDRNQSDLLTPEERQELLRLGAQADALTVKKAYAYALLRWRGFPLPTLEALERQL